MLPIVGGPAEDFDIVVDGVVCNVTGPGCVIEVVVELAVGGPGVDGKLMGTGARDVASGVDCNVGGPGVWPREGIVGALVVDCKVGGLRVERATGMPGVLLSCGGLADVITGGIGPPVDGCTGGPGDVRTLGATGDSAAGNSAATRGVTGGENSGVSGGENNGNSDVNGRLGLEVRNSHGDVCGEVTEVDADVD